MKYLECKSNKEWTGWLKKNHKTENLVWLVFYKKDKSDFILDYEFAVEEALCYGWIDSIIKKIDDEKYCRKFTIRKEKSNWSEPNKKRVAKLLKEKRMQPAGKRLIDIAKKNGTWDKKNVQDVSKEVSEEFQSALDKNKTAGKFFDELNKSDKRPFILWINSAKKEETKSKRIKESIKLLSKKEKLGLR